MLPTRAFAGRLRLAGIRLAGSAAAVVLVTAAIYGLRGSVPVLSLGVLYLFAVLPVAVVWGSAYALAVAVGSMATYNFLFFEPVHTFRLTERENWLALAVYLVTAVVVSELAARARRRAAEAEQREREDALLAELSTGLLQGREVADEVARGAPAIAALFGADAARVELGPAGRGRPGESAHALVADGRRVGTLHLTRPRLAGRHRFPLALASMLAVALDRERLAREALEAEALRRSDAVKTAVLRAVSHDLRTPLTAIRVAAEGLSSPALELSSEDRAALLETIRTEVGRLQRVVGDLLDLSRLQAGAVEPELEVWTLDELLSQSLYALGADRERVDLAPFDEALLVRVDAVQVERVLVNLLDNALKFSPPASAARLTVERTPDAVLLRVEDRGPGVPAGELERVFEPFHTAGTGTGRGSGLGLAIARGFAEANGGRVWAERRPDRGSTFVLALPAAPAHVAVGV